MTLGIITGYLQLNPEIFSQYRELEEAIVNDALPDRSGNILIRSMYNIYAYDQSTHCFKTYDFHSLTDFPVFTQPAKDSAWD